MVTVMVTSHKVTEKNIEDSGRNDVIIIYIIHIGLKVNTWSLG